MKTERSNSASTSRVLGAFRTLSPITTFFATLIALLILSGLSLQALNLPRIFSNNMVLQRNLPIKIWGWANPGETVDVSFLTQNRSAVAAQDGKWMVTFGPTPANATPSEITITAGEKHVTLKNILVGEVWICSGQSNMEFTLKETDRAKEAIETADYPLIRQFKAPHVTNNIPQKDVPGSWAICTPGTAPDFTAAGYHFALELQKNLHVPIGLINTSWGGTRIEPWTDPEGFKVSDKLNDISELIANSDNQNIKNQFAYLDKLENWAKTSRETLKAGTKLANYPGGIPDHPLNGPGKPTGIYNAMIAPLVPYGIRGAIWYQGESNNGEGMLYYEKMKALISSWRRIWGQGEFPFLYVQLAPYTYGKPENLPAIWEAQSAALNISNTGMAVTTDIGNVSDIHPKNKAEIGRRLALWALAKTYVVGSAEYSGPVYTAMKIKGKKIILTFDHGTGLKSNDSKPLTWFTIAGKDKKFIAAKAEIVGNTIVVSNDGLKKPAAVRFGWSELAEPNLVNGSGLPASPFRTDK